VRERDVRLSQTVAPFGVGAIYDYRGESLIAQDIGKWDGGGRPIHLDRLAVDLGVTGFKSAPARSGRSTTGPRLPFVRFPRWLFCPTCRDLIRWRDSDEVLGEPARCTACPRRPQLVPMRFVVVCEEGHLGDVQWDRWAHAGARTDEQKQCRGSSLKFLSQPEAGTGLRALVVRCTSCKSQESLDGITSGAPHDGIVCSGKQPWVYSETPVSCEATPRVVQRGASNLYFAEVRSAIDIPPESDFEVYDDVTSLVANAKGFDMLLAEPPGEALYMLLVTRIAGEVGVEERRVEEVVAAKAAEIEGTARAQSTLTGDLRRDEWSALRAQRRNQDARNHFITRHEPLVPADGEDPVLRMLGERLADTVLVTRLREVRTLKSFRRYSTEGVEIRPGLERRLDWLPAIEVFGEGVFLSFDEDVLQEWERRDQVIARVRELEERRKDSFVGARVRVASPRFVLLHTFAHLLIRRLAFECGYTAASLRERIYCAEAGRESEPFAGVLVYTASGDAEGTLGGLVRQGRTPRMAETILAMLEDAAWCSSDPICIESRGQGYEGLNRGACHACALLAETSCEYANALLDRGVVVGGDGVGLFADVLDAALTATGDER
jgi:hypothetical protein